MSAFSNLFGSAVALRNRLYDSGTFEQRRLQGPVVSVGNISVGGSGKTPFTMMLGDLLLERGIEFDILSRGYRRKSADVLLVNPNGNASEFGDEPLLMARHFAQSSKPVHVMVGRDRYHAGLLMERKFGARLHLLDDGFQHRRLARDFDIVLLSESDFEEKLLPVGRLREPLSSLRRAHAVVIAPEADASRLPVPEECVWRVGRSITFPANSASHRPVAFCGVARPERFFADLRSRMVTPVAEIAFRDHHAYTRADIDRLNQIARRNSADSFLTTEKDMMNLGERILDFPLPVAAVQLRLSLADSERFLDLLLETVGKHRQTHS